MIFLSWFDASLRTRCGVIAPTRDDAISLHAALKVRATVSEISARCIENGERLLPERGFQEEGEIAMVGRLTRGAE